EGAIFLWLWFKDLPITSEILYQRLKDRGVLVVPGHYFFPGMGAEAQGRECLRITYAQAQEVVEQGLAIVADEVRKAYAERRA
ncbi:MAG: valine--pyruvate transaminase, partial [Gammaproteobacteria bacterium]